MTIVIDPDRYMGSENCGFYAPTTFDLDEEIALAAEGCPTNAIRLGEA